MLPRVPHGRVDEAAAARDAFGLCWAADIEQGEDELGLRKVECCTFLVACRRFDDVMGFLPSPGRGRAMAGLPMYQLVSSPNISPSSSPPPKASDVQRAAPPHHLGALLAFRPSRRPSFASRACLP